MIRIEFNSNFGSEEPWKKKISEALDKIKSTPTGELLINTINHEMKEGNGVVTIKSQEKYGARYPYPKMTYYGGKNDIEVIIPDQPYNSLVKVIDKDLLDVSDTNNNHSISFKYLGHICNLMPVPQHIAGNDIIKKEKDEHKDVVNSLCYEQKQPYEIILAHELIHAIRLIKDNDDEKLEEEATIFGVKNKTLIVDTKMITENVIRKELGYPLRINHCGRIIY